MKKTEMISTLLAAVVAIGGTLPVNIACSEADMYADGEYLTNVSGGKLAGVSSSNDPIEGGSNSYLHIDNQPLGNCVLTLNLMTDMLSPDNKYVVGFKVRSQVDSQSFRGIRYSVGGITRFPVSPVGEEWISHVSNEFSVNTETNTLASSFQGDTNYFSINPSDIDDLGVYVAKKSSDGKYIMDSSTAVYYNDFEGGGDEYSASNACASYAFLQTETEYFRFDGAEGVINVEDGVKLEAGTYLLRGEARMAYFFNGALNASTPDSRHTYTEADEKGVVHDGGCAKCKTFAGTSGNAKDRNDAKYKLSRHLVFGNPGDSEKYRDTSLHNDGKTSYQHIVYKWASSSEIWRHANYRSLTARADGVTDDGKSVTYGLVFLTNSGTNDATLEPRYRSVAGNGSSIHITDDWSSFAALLIVEEEMELKSVLFGGVDSKLDFDTFDVRNLSLKKGDASEIEITNNGTLGNDKDDILGERTMETHFNKNSGGWDIDPASDVVSDGALTINAGTPTRNITRDVETKNKCEIEFRYKINKYGGECGFKYEYGGQRIFIQFIPNALRVVGYGDTQTMINNINQYEYNTYKLTVEGNVCDLYVNGEYQLTYFLPLRANPVHPDKLSFFVNNSSVSIDYVTFDSKDAPISAEFLTGGLMHQEGGRATVKATCVDEAAGVPYVEYYSNGSYIGKATADEDYTLTWRNLIAGTYLIEARYQDHTSDKLVLEVASLGLVADVTVNKDSFNAGEMVNLGLSRNLTDVKSVVYYVNGIAVKGSSVTADTVGRNTVTALITYTDGSFAYTDTVYYDVVSDTDSGVKLLPSYVAEYTASADGKITASDGVYLLELSHSADAVTYVTSDGVETYSLGLGNYRTCVDGGVCDVYYNGQFAFSYRMPVTDRTNGIITASVSGLRLSGINGTIAVIKSDGNVYDIPDISQKYAVEFVFDGKKDFELAMSDGAWETNLTAAGGKVSVNTYPNLSSGIVETDEAMILEEGKHICRISVVNGLAQIFVDNVWKHSFRMPQAFTAPYISSVGLDTVTVRQTEDSYIFSDSFDGTAELGSSAYWEERDGVKVEFQNSSMTLSAHTKEEPQSGAVTNITFDSDEVPFNGDGYSVSNGIMTVKNSDHTVSKNIIADIEPSKDFVFEVRAKVIAFGAETGMKLEYPTHRIIAYFGQAGTLTVKGANGDFVASVNPAEWHTYRFAVTDTSKCDLFIDGEYQGTFELMAKKHTASVISFFSKPREGKTTCIEVDSVLYQRNDTAAFETGIDLQTATLKAICLDAEISATVKVNKADKGGVYLTARYDSKYNNLIAGYNFDNKAWEFVRNSGAAKVLASIPGELPLGKEVKLDLSVEGTNAVLYVDGVQTLSCTNAAANMYGSVGVSIDRVTAEVHDYSYRGTSRPIPGAATVINDAVTPEIFEFAEANIYMIVDGGTGYESTDDGLTWERASFGKYSKNTVRLASGTIVYCVRKSHGTDLYVDYTYVSTDNGETWEGPFPVQSYIRNRITMNCKFTEVSSGRLFFVSGEAGHGVEDEGGFRVFYSDDEGRTWHGSNMLCLDGVTVLSGEDEARMDMENTGVNAQECMVVEMPDGTLRAYGRTDEGFLYYSVSTDNGTTWTAEMHTTPIMAVLSAYQVARDPYTGDYYAAWEYNVVNDNAIEQRPRNRVALAVSRDDMKTWEYIGDIHLSLNDYQANAHYNIGMRVTSTAVYVDVIHASYIAAPDGAQSQVNYMVRVDKSTMKTTERFTGAIPLSVTAPSLAGKQLLESSMAVSADGSRAFTGDKIFNIDTPAAGYVPAHVLADHLGAVCKSDGKSAVLTLGTVDYVFTAGKTHVSAGDKTFSLSNVPVSGKNGIMIPLQALSEVFSRSLVISTNGVWVSYNEQFRQGTDITSEDVGAYLPVKVGERSASENDIPDAWAIPEVSAAHGERIIPSSINSEYRLPITRGEFCELIMTMLLKKTECGTHKALVEKLGFSFENKFTDTEHSYIVAANCIGIVNGRGNGIFDPNAGITRQEAAVMLANAAKVLEIKGGELMSFSDMPSTASWAQDAISTITSIVSAAGSRVMGGVGNGMFDPLGAYSRQQAILTAYRLYMCK